MIHNRGPVDQCEFPDPYGQRRPPDDEFLKPVAGGADQQIVAVVAGTVVGGEQRLPTRYFLADHSEHVRRHLVEVEGDRSGRKLVAGQVFIFEFLNESQQLLIDGVIKVVALVEINRGEAETSGNCEEQGIAEGDFELHRPERRAVTPEHTRSPGRYGSICVQMVYLFFCAAGRPVIQRYWSGCRNGIPTHVP